MRRLSAARTFKTLASAAAAALFLMGDAALAQTTGVFGTVRSEAGATLPGAMVELRSDGAKRLTVTDAEGAYRFEAVSPGGRELLITLVNFAPSRRDIMMPGSGGLRLDVVLQLAFSADVTVTEKSTFINLADAEDPARDLIGIAQSASQGAITARQLDTRPVMRAGEVLETVPGVVISQHSGEGKANQRPAARGPVPSDGSAVDGRRTADAPADRTLGQSRRSEHRGRAGPARQHQQCRALPHGQEAAARDDPRGRGGSDECRGIRAKRTAVDVMASNPRRSARRWVSLSG